ncbi:MAG: SDR family oxidoreductase [Myxococcota bacterium]
MAGIFDLTGRLALVTGAGQGIGAGIARHLAAQGARVVVNDIRQERAEATAEVVRRAGGQAEALAFDVTDREAVRAAIATRGFDVVVNNAGNAGAQLMHPRRFRDMDPSDGRADRRQPARRDEHDPRRARGMCDRGFGRLVTISSGAGVVGLPIGVAPYGASKGGALAFMRHIAIENAGSGVTANSIALGMMEMTEVHDAALVAKLAASVPCRRLGTGDDVGPAVVWLASDQAGWVTGQTIHVNGGGLTT